MEFEYDIGSFEYDMDGFYINFERLKIYIEWNEINAIFSSYIYDEYAPEFLEVFTDKTSIRIDENIRGYHVFSNKMSDQFLQIKNNWKIDMKEHLFRKNRRLLYERNGLLQAEAFKKYYSYNRILHKIPLSLI